MRWLALLAALAGGAAPALAQDEVEVELGSLFSRGDERRSDELWQRPEDLWLRAALRTTIDTSIFRGRARLELSTEAVGLARLDGRVGETTRVRLWVQRSRMPFDVNARVPGALVLDAAALEVAHEQLRFALARPLGPLGGQLELDLELHRFDGERPTLATGPLDSSPLVFAFGRPGFREVDNRTGRLELRYALTLRPVRLELAGALTLDDVDERLVLPGGLSQRQVTAAQTWELRLAASSADPGALLWGGSYRGLFTDADPGERREIEQTGTVFADDVDVDRTSHRAALGAAWQPLRSLRVSGRVEGRTWDHSGERRGIRDLGTFERVAARSSYDPYAFEARGEAHYAPWPELALELEGRGQILRGDDAWSQLFFLADGALLAAQRSRVLERERVAGVFEARAVTTVISGYRLTGGARLESAREDEDVESAVDAFRLGDRERERAGGFVSLRTRLGRSLRVDAGASVARESREVQEEAESRRWQLDVHARASGAIGPASLFAGGELSDNDYDLDPFKPTTLPANAALVELQTRSWVATAGVTADLGSGASAAALYSHVINERDLATSLQIASASLSVPLWGVQLEGRGGYLRFDDDLRPWDDTESLLVAARVTGTF